MAEIQLIKVSQLQEATDLNNLEILGIDRTNNSSVRALMSLLKGLDGKPVELQKSDTHIQWRVQGASTWTDLISVSLLKGDRGDNIELQKTSTHLQWRVVGGNWANLVTLEELKGTKGDDGKPVEFQKSATHLQWKIQGGSTWTNLITLEELKVKGDPGPSVELQVISTHIQWRVTGTTTWNNLVALSELKGATGSNIELQKSSTHIQWRVEGGSWANLVPLSDLVGATGKTPVLGTITAEKVSAETAPSFTLTNSGNDENGNPIYTGTIKIPAGKDGEDGADALEPIFIAGTTTTLDPEQPATADIVADGFTPEGSPKFKINLSIPRGPKGNPGDGSGNVVILNEVSGVSTKRYVLKPSIDGSLEYTIEEVSFDVAGTGIAFTQAENRTNIATGETIATVFGKIRKWFADLGALAFKNTVAKSDLASDVQASLGKADSALQDFTETDPTVPAWAKADNKPSYTATEIGAISASLRGSANGVAELDAAGKVPSNQLPSYVDDVLEYSNLAAFPITGETGKIYVAIDTNKVYRWGGSGYVIIADGVALGETSSTAYRGDRGKTAYDHSQSTHAPANAQKNSDITKAEIEAKLTGNITSHTHDDKIDASKFQVVVELPSNPDPDTFYFIPE